MREFRAVAKEEQLELRTGPGDGYYRRIREVSARSNVELRELWAPLGDGDYGRVCKVFAANNVELAEPWVVLGDGEDRCVGERSGDCGSGTCSRLPQEPMFRICGSFAKLR